MELLEKFNDPKISIYTQNCSMYGDWLDYFSKFPNTDLDADIAVLLKYENDTQYSVSIAEQEQYNKSWNCIKNAFNLEMENKSNISELLKIVGMRI
jgi:hypothetical protein